MDSEAVRGHQGPSEAIKRPSESIRGNPMQAEAVRGHQGPSGAIRGHQEAIRGNQRPSVALACRVA